MKTIIKSILGIIALTGLALAFTTATRAVPGDNPITPITPTTESGLATGGVKAMTDDELEIKLNFNAHQGSVWGEAMYSDSTGAKFKGKVDVCYFQSGNEAVFAGTVKKGNVDEGYFKVQVQDNGEGKNASPDMLGVWLSDEVPECTMEGTMSATVQKGNLQVH